MDELLSDTPIEPIAIKQIKVGDIVKVVRDFAGHSQKMGRFFKVKNIEEEPSLSFVVARFNEFDEPTITQRIKRYYMEGLNYFFAEGDIVLANESELLDKECAECSKFLGCLEIFTDNENLPYCRDCYDELFFICDDCHNEGERGEDENNINDDKIVCNNCYDDYNYCEQCDRHIYADDYNYDESMCQNCWENEREECGNDERKYSKDNTYAKGKDRIYAVEIETNFDDYQDRKNLFSMLPEEIGITHDGSLGSHGVELQTPKLNGKEGDELLKQVCQHLNENNFSVDKACGLHIHIDTSDYFKVDTELIKKKIDYHYGRVSDKDYAKLTPQMIDSIIVDRLKKLMLFYLAFESVLYSFLPMTRRTNRYCYPLSEFYHEMEINNVSQVEAFEKIWYREQEKNAVENRKKEKYDNTRYAGYNFHSMLANKHIEARHHSGTQDYHKIKNWIDLNVRILDFVMSEGIKTEELKKVKHAIGLPQKTKIFFEMLAIPKKLQAYFLARQKKFNEGTMAEQENLQDN